MGRILDLTCFAEKTFDIKMMDGKMLHIKKPTQQMVIRILELKDISENSEPSKIITALDSLVFAILNTNTDNVEIDKATVEAMGFDVKMAIIKAYTEFLTELQSDPNS